MVDEYETLEKGRGFPLVLLHGLMGDPANWAGVLPHLPSTCRAIALRFPFFQDTSDNHRLNTLPKIKEHARGYLDHAEIERSVLCGNSLGGHVALHLALEMPRRVAGLVLTGSSGLFERTVTGQRGANPPRQWLYDKMCEIFYDDAMVTEEMLDDVVDVVAQRRFARDLVRIAKSAKRDNLADRLGDVACPVLLIWGRQDKITPPEVAEEFRSRLPHCTLSWIDRCGHAPMMERPREFGRTLGKWWRRRICKPGALTGSSKTR
jgi:pimeloyl-ACP methyl ester carboxylesterase